MNLKSLFAISGAAGALVVIAALGAPSRAAAQAPVPYAGSQEAAPAPSSAYVWMSGRWNMEAGQWKWLAAHWELPPTRSAVWIGGHWAPGNGAWVWVNGAWNVADAPQSQAAPPLPPGASIPVPSTPPPPLGASFYDNGVAQGAPATTDYGPINYAVADPGYYGAADPYWDAYPWMWGYPGGYFGFGFGPAYFGYGRGYRGYPYGGGYGRWHGATAGRAGAGGGHFSGHAGGSIGAGHH